MLNVLNPDNSVFCAPAATFVVYTLVVSDFLGVSIFILTSSIGSSPVFVNSISSSSVCRLCVVKYPEDFIPLPEVLLGASPG